MEGMSLGGPLLPAAGATPALVAAGIGEKDSQEVEMGRVEAGASRDVVRRFAALVMIFALAVLPACSGKKSSTETTYDEETAGMGESDFARGSLDEYRRGSLGRGEQGPLADVYFGYDSFELSDNAREILRANADWLEENREARVEIEGHCDSRGTIEYNLALGAKRANAVRDYLASLGVSPERMTTISYGKELPVCHEETESCWAENRRAHFVVLNR